VVGETARIPEGPPSTAGSSCLPALFAPGDDKKYPSIKLHGAINADAGWWSQDPANRRTVGNLQDGVDFRRARFGVSGAAWENVHYWLQMEFAFPGRPTFTDVWVEVNEVPLLGNVRMGQWKLPFSVEIVTSFRFNPFFERSPVFLLAPFRHIGIGFHDHSEDESVTWAAATFRPGNDQFGGDQGDAGGGSLVGRLTWNPVYEGDSERVFFVGGAYWMTDPSNDTLRFGIFGGNSPEFALILGTTITPSFVDTGLIRTHSFQAETAVVLGPLSIQAEAAYSYLDQMGGPPLNFFAGYVFATYFLTGEHRQFNRKLAGFDRVKLHSDFNPCQNGTCRGGAWEVAARLSYIDLTDANIQGGRLTDITLGLNWYLNPYTRLSFNYIHAFLDRAPIGESEADIYAIRAQVDF
jgi:phosphate-selective porin OprO/OprP